MPSARPSRHRIHSFSPTGRWLHSNGAGQGLLRCFFGGYYWDPWADVLTDEGKRALTPLFWMRIQPYGEARLNMGSRLQLAVTVFNDPELEPAT